METPAAPSIKPVDGKTFSEALGIAQSESLKQYLTSRENIDAAHLAEAMKGMMAEISDEERAKALAYAAGLRIAQINKQNLPYFNKQAAGSMDTTYVDVNTFQNALSKAVLGETCTMTADSAMKVVENQIKYQQEIYKARNLDWLAQNAKLKGVQRLADGLQYRILTEGTGPVADDSTEVDCYLADYRASKEADRYYLDTWQWVDLRPLGKVKTIAVSLSGSDTGSFGLNTSAYFCMDDFNGERVIAEAPVQVAGDEIDLSEFFTFDDASATVSYAFADALSEELAQNVTLSADGRLTVKKGYYNSFNVVVSATQKGKIQFLNIPFDIVDGINGVEDSSSNVAGRYNISGQKLNARQKGVNIIRTTNGKTVKVGVR